MTECRLIVYGREMHLDVDEPLAVGDTVKIVRGNGPREGERMGVATVTGFDENGAPTLTLTFDTGGGRDG